MVADALDVVTLLGAHQQNLAPRPGRPTRVALVALPLPPIAAALEIDGPVRDQRDRELRALAAELGGGDGPATVIDLDADDRPLSTILSDLAHAGVDDVVLHGARDQPGFARAVVLRWPRGVRFAPPGRDSALAALMDDPSLGTEQPHAPFAEPARRSYVVDRERALGPWSGFLPPGARLGTAGARRNAWVAYWSERGPAAREAVRCAALGLDPVLEARLRTPGPAPATAATSALPVVFTVTGSDGSGKSTQAWRLAASLGQRGFAVRVLKMYRQGAFLELADELGGRTLTGAPLAAFRVSRGVKLVDSLRALRDEIEPGAARHDVLVFDRHVDTHLAAARAQLGWDLAGHPSLAPFPAAAATFLMELDVDVALARIATRDARPSADEHPVGLRGYAREFDRLATAHGYVRIDAVGAEDDNAARILAHAEGVLARRGVTATRPATDPTGPAPAPTRGTASRERARLGVVIGGPAALCTLADDALRLCAFARERIGAAAEGFPEAFWIEAYAAQIVLDVRAHPRTGAARPRVALWPAALRRLALFSDLEMLDELERIALADATVLAVSPDPSGSEAAFAVLCPAAGARLSRSYHRALDELAAERAWATMDEALARDVPVSDTV